MADTTVPLGQSQAEGWLANAPGESFDDLFPPTEGIPAPTMAPPEGASPAPAAQPPATPEEPFLKAQTGTVYKTKDEAIKGIETKDATIQQLRQHIIATQGVDPLTGKPVVREPQAPVRYTEDRKRYFQDLKAAVDRGDEEAYFDTQQKLIQDIVQPFVPIMVGTAKEQALRAIPDEIRGYVGTSDYTETLNDVPLLAQAIQSAERTPELFNQLPDLYRLAYAQHVARKLPEITRAAQTPPPQTPAPRPTAGQATLTPPSTPQAQPSLTTREGRKAIIERAYASGLADMKI